MTVRIINADVFDGLKRLPDKSVHCCVTSPPYWGMRKYGGEQNMIGLESTFEEHVEKMVAVFREVRRVLRDDGSLWLNYGDGYWGGKGQSSQAWSSENQDRETLQKDHHHVAGKGQTRPTDGKHDIIKPKDLILMPATIAMALRADGWWIRSEIIWAKKNSMPESVQDRPTNAHEKVFLLTKSAKYFYDGVAVRVPSAYPNERRHPKGSEGAWEMDGRPKEKQPYGKKLRDSTLLGTSNLRNVWSMPTFSYPGNHYATFPPALAETCIKAGTSEEGVCSKCGAPAVREVKKRGGTTGRSWHNHENDETHGNKPGDRTMTAAFETGEYQVETVGWKRSCECDVELGAATILDCFGGSGTSGLVADRLQRNAILIEINPDYCDMARARILQDAPMFTEVEIE